MSQLGRTWNSLPSARENPIAKIKLISNATPSINRASSSPPEKGRRTSLTVVSTEIGLRVVILEDLGE